MSGSTPAPRPLRASIVLWWVVAALLVLQIAAMWLNRAALPTALPGGGADPGGAADRADRLLLGNTAAAGVFAVAYCALGAALFGRRPWARVVLTVVAVLHLLMLLGTGAVLGPQSVLLVIGVAAAVLLWHPTSGDWIAGEHD